VSVEFLLTSLIVIVSPGTGVLYTLAAGLSRGSRASVVAAFLGSGRRNAGTPFENVVGICHSVRDTHEFLARTVGVPEEQIDFVTAGFNHQAFVLRFTRDGEDLYPLLRDAVEKDPDGLGRRIRVELFKQFGYFPTESSEHSAEYVPWFLRSDDMIERYRIPVDEYIRRSDENLDEFAHMRALLDSGAGFDIEPTSELASEIIQSIETGRERNVYVNVRNQGLIDSLPTDCCVEVPATVDAKGVHQVAVGELPAQLAALNRTFLNVVELTVQAVLQDSRDLVYEAAVMDPNTAATLGLDEIHRMCDELIEAHGDLMPPGIRS
jgi:alpha-galactosidase